MKWCKRYELKLGKTPIDLAALVPEFLPAVPTDLMNGQPLHYRFEQNSGFTLYSVGEDAHDDGGSMIADSDNSDYPPPWNGKDLVWPQVAVDAIALKITNDSLRSVLK